MLNSRGNSLQIHFLLNLFLNINFTRLNLPLLLLNLSLLLGQLLLLVLLLERVLLKDERLVCHLVNHLLLLFLVLVPLGVELSGLGDDLLGAHELRK